MRDFIVSYRTSCLGMNEILVSIEVPLTTNNSHVTYYKQARRKDDDIAIVNACFYVELDANQSIHSSALAFGGVGPTIMLAESTSKIISGKQLSRSLVTAVLEALKHEIQISDNAPGGMIEYRMSLVSSFAFKFFMSVVSNVNAGAYSEQEMSAVMPFERSVSLGHQVFEAPLVNYNDGIDQVGKPLAHSSSLPQVGDLYEPIFLFHFFHV
jgi:xanthine dehydrogenase/oxidase